MLDAARFLEQLQGAALHGADEDAEHFKEYLHHRSLAVQPGRSAEQTTAFSLLCRSLKEIIDRISADVHEVVAGDIAPRERRSKPPRQIHLGTRRRLRALPEASDLGLVRWRDLITVLPRAMFEFNTAGSKTTCSDC